MRPHLIIRSAILVAGFALVPALVPAQDAANGRRIEEPNTPVEVGADYDRFTWQTVAIPDPAQGVVTGTLWSDPNGVTYVTGEAPGALFGPSADEIYASTNLPDGTVAMYRFDGTAWSREPFPGGVPGPAGTIAGEHNNIFFRNGDAIFRERGGRWTRVYFDERLLSGGELVYERGRMIALARDAYAFFDGGTWQWKPLGFSAVLNGTSAVRDAAGVLHFFATGSDPESRAVRVYQFNEAQPYTLEGDFVEVDIGDTPGGPRTGFGIDVYAVAAHEVYVTGCVCGCGCIHEFNGSSWADIHPASPMMMATGISGNQHGDLAMALADGRLLLGTRCDPLVAAVAAGDDHGPDAPAFNVRQESANVAVIEFTLPQAERVSLAVYSVAGRRVTLLDRSVREAGRHEIRWNADGAARGIYFCRLTTGATTSSRTIVIGR